MQSGDMLIVEHCLGAPVTAVRELPAPPSTSYAVRRLLIDLGDGRTLDVFHKNFDVSPHEPHVALSRGRRECYVYENVLAGLELGTAELYGTAWSDRGAPHWLLLEFVHGRKLRRSPPDDRLAAAGWLGRLRSSLNGRLPEIAATGILLEYNDAYFAETAERARHAVGSRRGSLRHRLETALADYETIIHDICSAEQTLVHGSYRAKNILVDESVSAIRICAADWELAAVGPALHDLAFLADGADPPLIEQLCESYVAAAGVSGWNAAEMTAELDRLRLHKALRSLGRSAEWAYSEKVVTKLVNRAERLRRCLD